MAVVHGYMKRSVPVGVMMLLVALSGLPSAQTEYSSEALSAFGRGPVERAENYSLCPAATPSRLQKPEHCDPGLYTVTAASEQEALPGEEAETEQRGERQPVWRFRDCPGCPEMVVVPGGSFMMGSPPGEAGRFNNEGPQHRVVIGRPFAVGVFEVTRGEFERFAEGTDHPSGGACWWWDEEQGRAIQRQDRNWRDPGFEQTDRHPVVCVNWEDAQSYVGWLSKKTGHAYRLLSESEWEYAARNGNGAVLGRE